MENELLTIREVAKRLRVDGTTVRRWISSHAFSPEDIVILPHVNKRQAYRIKIHALEKLGVDYHG